MRKYPVVSSRGLPISNKPIHIYMTMFMGSSTMKNPHPTLAYLTEGATQTFHTHTKIFYLLFTGSSGFSTQVGIPTCPRNNFNLHTRSKHSIIYSTHTDMTVCYGLRDKMQTDKLQLPPFLHTMYYMLYIISYILYVIYYMYG